MEEVPLTPPTSSSTNPVANPSELAGTGGIDARGAQGTIIDNKGDVRQQYGDQYNFNLDLPAFIEALNRLGTQLADPDALVHLAVFRDRLQNASRLITTLRDCKKLHDRLHSLQVYTLRPIMFGASGFPKDQVFCDTLIEYLERFRATLNDIEQLILRNPLGDNETHWLRPLQIAHNKLNEALDTLNKPSLDKATGKMRSEISQHLVRANERLKSTVNALLDVHLAEIFDTVRNQVAPNRNAEVLKLYDDGIAMLRSFRQNLKAHVIEHDCWQLAEGTLQLIEFAPTDDLPDNWPDLITILEPLLNQNDAAWAQDMRGSLQKLEATMQANNPPAMRRAFIGLRSKAITRFFDVDNRLLELCEALLDFGPKLDGLLSKLPTS